ncbi:MAG: CBS domain-containing protein [Candidatus Bathyarchaeota archaeon]
MSSVLAKDIMRQDVRTIGPEEKIALARLTMLRHGVGALPVIQNDKTLVGILTLRDIDFAGREIMDLPVKDLMTKEHLITATEKTTLTQVADVMIRTGLQRIPVLDGEGKLLGLVTQSVVIRGFRTLFP